MRRPLQHPLQRLPQWTATLTWKAAAFITVMCCGLAALLGILVHVSVTDQTVGEARSRALDQLNEATTAYEAGDRLPQSAGVDLPGLPEQLRELAADGSRGTMVGDDQDRRPTMWAAGPADGGRALAVKFDYSQGAHAIEALDRAIVWSSALAIGATLLVGAFAMTRVTRRLHATARVARRTGFDRTGAKRARWLAIPERTRRAPLGRSFATARLARQTAFGGPGAK